jgi:hypothetical protein
MQVVVPISKNYWKNLKFTAISQLLMLVFTGFIADNGEVATWTIYSVCTFWVVAALILIRRPNSPTQWDLGFIRYGFWIIAFTYILAGQRIYEYVQRVVLKN